MTEGHRVTLPTAAFAHFRRFSLYNSPYPAHDHGCAIDFYPDSNDGISPVSGEVLETRTVRAPEKPYAVEHDHLIIVACDDEWCTAADIGTDEVTTDREGVEHERVVARILHVDPAVEAGDHVAVGDSLGEMVRSGFFAPWVDNHVHLGFRTPEQNLRRASGSLPLALPFEPTPLAWDGRGRVVDVDETYAVLDVPTHPGGEWCGVAADAEGSVGVLDGGFPHYDGGGFIGGGRRFGGNGTTDKAGESDESDANVSFLGHVVGDATGRDVSWRDVVVTANGAELKGLSLFCAHDEPFGVKLVCPGHTFERGDEVEVAVSTAVNRG